MGLLSYLNLFNTPTPAVTTIDLSTTYNVIHDRLDRRLENIQPKRYMMGRWIYMPLDAAMKAVGLEEVETYVLHHQNTAV